MGNTFCIFSANYLPNIGGVEKYTQNLAFALQDLGHSAVIVTNNCFDLPDYERLARNVSIYRLPCYPLIGGRLPLPRRNKRFRQLMSQLSGESIDYVSINTRFYPHSLIGVKFAESKGIKPLVTDHGSAYLTLGNTIIDVAVKAWEHIFSTVLKQHDIDFYGVSSASVAWLRTFGIKAKGELCNAIDARAFRESSSQRHFKQELGLSPDAFCIVFTGRFIPEKGIDKLLEAASLLKDQDDIQFLLAGDGPLMESAQSANLKNVHLLGKINAADIAALLLESDVFLSPTRSEGFSTSLLEAAACGTTPIITNVGGVKELLSEGEHGIVLSSTNPREIVSAIRALADNRALCEEMSYNLRIFVETHFSWRDTALSLIDACERAQTSHE